jgi:uncharacterized membrane protein
MSWLPYDPPQFLRIIMRNRVLAGEAIWLWTIVIAGSALRFYRLDFHSLWYDEGLQYYVVSHNSFAELFSQTRSFHPPLSFLINYAFFQIRESDLFLRLPSALFGIGSLPLFYMIARNLTNTRIALSSTVVLAVSPFHIWYSQDGRMYSQLLFFSLASSVLLLRAIERGGWSSWLLYIVVSAAGIYSHVFMLLALMTQFLWLLVHHRDRWLSHTVSGAMIFVVFLPWVMFLPWVRGFFQSVSEHGVRAEAQAGSIAAFRAGSSLETIPYTFFTYSSGFSLGPTIAELHENKSVAFILEFSPEILSVAVVFGILLVVGMYGLYKLFGARAVTLCILGIAIPLLGTLMYALAPRAAYNVRYTIVAFPYFCLLIGVGLTVIYDKQRALGVAFSFGVLTITSISLVNHFFNPRYAKEDVRSAVAFWRSEGRKGPLLSFSSYPVVIAYLDNGERGRHAPLGREIVADIRRSFSTTEAQSAYVLLARDWGMLREKAVRSTYVVIDERSFPGVKILKVSNPLHATDASGAL